jgi:hypothetical protein
MATRGVNVSPIVIGDSCIIEINEKLFLLVQIIFADTETVLVIRISAAQARDLVRGGVRQCPVFDNRPTQVQGVAIDLECVFVVGNNAFLVFETERPIERQERIFVVRAPLCPIIREEL